jgi:hypothetical protein
MSSVLGSALGGVKGATLNALSEQAPLTAKETFKAVQKEGTKATYQGVHKALGEMAAAGMLVKDDAGYSINRVWLGNLAQEISTIQASSDSKTFFAIPAKGRMFSAFRALSLLKHLLLSGNLTLSKDELYLFGHKICMIPMYQYLLWHIELKKKPGLLYKTVRDMSVSWYSEMRRTGVTRGDLDVELQHGIDTLSIVGWGSLNIEQIDTANKTAFVTVDYSPFAVEYLNRFGKSKEPVDDFLRGCLAGGFAVMYGDPAIEAKETKCIAKGDQKCVFEVGPTKGGFKRGKATRSDMLF